MGYNCLKIGYLFGILVLTISILLFSFKGTIIKYFINQNIRLEPGTFLYDTWANQSSTINLFTNFYVFDLKNSEEFVQNGSKPIFKEIGPFVYKEIRLKEDILHNRVNGTLSYKERRRFFFIPELSAYPENYTITQINMGAITVINYVKNWSHFKLELVNLALKLAGETLVVRQPAGKLLFGYEDPFLKMLLKFDKSLFPSAMIGLYYGKNDTIDGQYTVNDGVADSQKVGQIDTFNGMKNLSIWTSSYANQINGTDGSINFPFMNKFSVPSTYQSDACRSVWLVYNETYRAVENIDLYGYIMNENLFSNASVNPMNKGFCTPANNCLPSGVFNLSTCVKIGSAYIPAYLSLPHYLFGDDILLNEIEGLKPNFTKHRTIVYFEPLTGIPMKANKRIQISTKLMRVENISLSSKLPEVYFPLFWIDENFEVGKRDGKLFFKKVKLPLFIYDFLKYSTLANGLVAFIFCTFSTFIITYRNKRNEVERGVERVDDDENIANIITNETDSNDVIEPNENTPLVAQS